eukprot:9186960-Pyramimonas_sp.AAC.1
MSSDWTFTRHRGAVAEAEPFNAREPATGTNKVQRACDVSRAQGDSSGEKVGNWTQGEKRGRVSE